MNGSIWQINTLNHEGIMQKHNPIAWLYSFVVIGIVIQGCAPYRGTALPSERATQVPGSSLPPAILILDISGKVELTREEWDPDVRVNISPGAEFHQGDLLYLKENTRVEILCHDLTTQTLSRSKSYGLGEICPEKEAVLWTNDQNLVSPPRGQDITIPYVLSPRATLIMNDKPILKWTPAAGAKSYTVRVEADSVVFSTTTTATSIVYSGDKLIPGKIYRLVVIPDTSARRTDQDPNRVFSLLDQESAAAIRAATEQVQGLDLSTVHEYLVITHIYRNHGLYGEAIQQLDEQLAPVQTKNGRLAAQLGELYLQVGLPELAVSWCKTAVSVAEALDDRDMLARALVCQARGLAASGKLDLARTTIQQARDLYVQFGDDSAVEEIDKAIH